jgi:hypothetical protein
MGPATVSKSRFVTVAGKVWWLIVGAIAILANLAQLTGYSGRDLPEIFHSEPESRNVLLQDYSADRGMALYNNTQVTNSSPSVRSRTLRTVRND